MPTETLPTSLELIGDIDCNCCALRKGVVRSATITLEGRPAWVCEECEKSCGYCGLSGTHSATCPYHPDVIADDERWARQREAEEREFDRSPFCGSWAVEGRIERSFTR